MARMDSTLGDEEGVLIIQRIIHPSKGVYYD
jgi:hypothetical protein